MEAVRQAVGDIPLFNFVAMHLEDEEKPKARPGFSTMMPGDVGELLSKGALLAAVVPAAQAHAGARCAAPGRPPRSVCD